MLEPELRNVQRTSRSAAAEVPGQPQSSLVEPRANVTRNPPPASRSSVPENVPLRAFHPESLEDRCQIDLFQRSAGDSKLEWRAPARGTRQAHEAARDTGPRA